MRRILYCFLFIAGGGIIHASAREERVRTEDRIKSDSVLFVDSFDGSSVSAPIQQSGNFVRMLTMPGHSILGV